MARVDPGAEPKQVVGETAKSRDPERLPMAREAQTVTLRSTIARELAFVLSHTIHHNATIRGMVIALGLSAPASLGYAPSTLAHMDMCRCVR